MRLLQYIGIIIVMASVVPGHAAERRHADTVLPAGGDRGKEPDGTSMQCQGSMWTEPCSSLAGRDAEGLVALAAWLLRDQPEARRHLRVVAKAQQLLAATAHHCVPKVDAAGLQRQVRQLACACHLHGKTHSRACVSS